ncbi:hypothetical protein BFJ70_g4041 [Fusarium oxysporum]|nr:hypothetical protein BFJ70_g4041 [Fusarium oxysporum]
MPIAGNVNINVDVGVNADANTDPDSFGFLATSLVPDRG